jgi:hypothetical protein
MKHTNTYNNAKELWYAIQQWQRFAWLIKDRYIMPYSYKEKADKLLDMALYLEKTLIHAGYASIYIGLISEAKKAYLEIYNGIKWTH